MFMQPEFFQGLYWEIETAEGTEYLPGDLAPLEKDLNTYYPPDCRQSAERKKGWLGRLSAPGYLDCTPWIPGDTQEAVELELRREFYDLDDENAGSEE